MKKTVNIFGGGTFSYVRNHLALATPAFGKAARELTDYALEKWGDKMDVHLFLTKMALNSSNIITNEDVEKVVDRLIEDLQTKVIIFNVGLCDFKGQVDGLIGWKYGTRLKTSEGNKLMSLTPSEKILNKIRKARKDIFLVAFKTTCGASEKDQYLAGLDLLKKNSCNLVLANDVLTKLNMIITPEEATYHKTTDRQEALKQLIDMTYHRSHLTFTKSTVVEGHPIKWESGLVFESLRTVVEFCISQNAYKPFNGATVGQFACKIGEKEFLTSIRKSNFNDLKQNGLVKIVTDKDDTVIAYGAKPSVGGQSQRIIFSEHQDYDCIVHFHCPIKPESLVPIVSQREYECGSHQCGQNTSNGLKRFGNLSAVMLDNHGPNIVFHHSINPAEVIRFITDNFELSQKTGGLVE